ncbi:hypothetical protein [Leptospira sp. GIMC2001]|uniref:hypothetical protein n=1 Tax=Leptospira sp. GIMC2001 TaxID=1513297 RepID=UPI00234A0ACA|nr:hypothetical protein [Leptospira sp. GIMC2001]WCL47631.1 hypothetical protein O4O04_01295 [Leptospira sp. GIMC2001]
MLFSGVINPKSSLLLSFFLGAGLVAVVSIAPVRDNIERKNPAPNKSRSIESGFETEIKSRAFSPNSNSAKFLNKQKKSESFLFNLHISPKEIEEYERQNEDTKNRLSLESTRFSRILESNSFSPQDNMKFSNDASARTVDYNHSGLEVNSTIVGVARPMFMNNYHTTRFYRNRRGQLDLNHIDLQYPISRSISAVITTSSRDIYDDRLSDGLTSNIPMAGFSFKGGNFFTTRIVGGDLNMHSSRNRSAYFNNDLSSVQASRSSGLGERDRINNRTLEWQTNVTPTKGIRFQTAFFNNQIVQQSDPNQNLSNAPDSGRMSVFLGKKSVILNVKYDYRLTNTNLRSVMYQWEPNQDSASVGLIFFLDQAQKYSFYVGGNQFNIADSNSRGTRSSSNSGDSRQPPSFTASIRGKTYGDTKANFFLNFQNQPPGFYGLGVQNPLLDPNSANQGSKSFYEYATRLGMEVNF